MAKQKPRCNMENKIKITLICLTLTVFLFGREAEARCLPMPNLLGKIQKTETGTNISYEYSCNECAACFVNDKSGCWEDGKTGECVFNTESRASDEYKKIVIENKQVCNSIGERWLEFFKNDNYIILPPEIIENGDIFFSVGGCGTPNPTEIFLYNKNAELKYGHIRPSASQITSKTIDKITILPYKKNKISCQDEICTYSAEFGINGERIILKPNQVFRGENFTLKYLGSSFAEGVWIEDFSDHFDYEIYFEHTNRK